MDRISREKLLSIGPELRTEEVEVGDWGGSLLIRELTGAQRQEVETALMRLKEKGIQSNVREKVAQYSIINDDGEPYFSKKDQALLGTYSASGLDIVFMKVLDMSGMSDDAQKLAAEELEKNPPD